MVTAEELKKIFLFRNVSEPILKLIAEAAEEVAFSPGEPITMEDAPANALYLIRSGTVRATRREKTVPVTFGSGESFGQVSALDGGPAGISTVALERVDAVALRPARLVEKLGGDPAAGFELFRAVARSLAARLRRVVEEPSATNDAAAAW